MTSTAGGTGQATAFGTSVGPLLLVSKVEWIRAKGGCPEADRVPQPLSGELRFESANAANGAATGRSVNFVKNMAVIPLTSLGIVIPLMYFGLFLIGSDPMLKSSACFRRCRSPLRCAVVR